MSLVNRWNRQLVDPVLNFGNLDRFSVNAGDSLDVQQFLGQIGSEDVEVDLWRGKGLDPYGEAVSELGDKVKTRSRDFLVKAGDIPLGVAEVSVSDPDGSLNRSAGLSFEWKNSDFGSIQSRVTSMVEDSGVKIPEKLAKYAGASQVKAGGSFDVDRDIDDFDDALRAFGANTVSFTTPTEETGSNTGNNAMDKSTFLNKKTLAVAGAAAAVGFIVIKK